MFLVNDMDARLSNSCASCYRLYRPTLGIAKNLIHLHLGGCSKEHLCFQNGNHRKKLIVLVELRSLHFIPGSDPK